jgi:hypothetical protein
MFDSNTRLNDRMPSIIPIRDAVRALHDCHDDLLSVQPSLFGEAAAIRIAEVSTQRDELVLVASDLHASGRVRNDQPPEHLTRYTSFEYLALLGSIVAGKSGNNRAERR